MTNPIDKLTDTQKTTILTAIWLMSRRTPVSSYAIDTMISSSTNPDVAKEPDAWEQEQADDEADNTQSGSVYNA